MSGVFIPITLDSNIECEKGKRGVGSVCVCVCGGEREGGAVLNQPYSTVNKDAMLSAHVDTIEVKLL